jgi:multidrug efflux pump subunit AcrB
LRPILKASLAMIIGLMPYASSARALIGGLLVSAVLTVFLVPAFLLRAPVTCASQIAG